MNLMSFLNCYLVLMVSNAGIKTKLRVNSQLLNVIRHRSVEVKLCHLYANELKVAKVTISR